MTSMIHGSKDKVVIDQRMIGYRAWQLKPASNILRPMNHPVHLTVSIPMQYTVVGGQMLRSSVPFPSPLSIPVRFLFLWSKALFFRHTSISILVGTDRGQGSEGHQPLLQINRISKVVFWHPSPHVYNPKTPKRKPTPPPLFNPLAP